MTPEHPLTKDIEQKAVDLRRQLLALEDDPLPIPPTPNLVEARVPEAKLQVSALLGVILWNDLRSNMKSNWRNFARPNATSKQHRTDNQGLGGACGEFESLASNCLKF